MALTTVQKPIKFSDGSTGQGSFATDGANLFPVSVLVDGNGIPITQLTGLPVTVANLPLPLGSATSAKQDASNTLLTNIQATLASNASAQGTVNVTNFPTVQTIVANSLPLPIGAATSAKQDSIVSSIGNLQTSLNTNLKEGGTVSVNTLPLATNAATSAKQDTTNSVLQSLLTALGNPLQTGGNVSVGNFPTNQQVTAASLPLPDGAANAIKQDESKFVLQTILTNLGSPVQDGGSVSVLNFPATQAVSISSLPLATNAATSAKQDSTNGLLSSIQAALSGNLLVSGSVSISNFPANQQVFTTSLPLPNGASTSALQNTTLAAIQSLQLAVGTPLQNGSSLAVSNFPTVQTVVANSLPLPAGAATETTLGNLNSVMQSVLTALQNQRTESIFTDATGNYFVRIDNISSIIWTDLNGNVNSGPGAGAHPVADSSSLLDKSSFQATANGNGYNNQDYIEHYLVTNPSSGTVVGNFWVNSTQSTVLPVGPPSSDITPISILATGAATLSAQLTGNDTLSSILTNLGNPLQNNGTIAVSNFPASQAVTVTTIPLAPNAANAAKQDITNSNLNTLITAVGNPLQNNGIVNVANLPNVQAISATSLPLPAGAATSVLQNSSNALLTNILTALGANLTVTGTVNIGNFPATQAVSLTTVPLPVGAATSAKQDTSNTTLNNIFNEITVLGALTDQPALTSTDSSLTLTQLNRLLAKQGEATAIWQQNLSNLVKTTPSVSSNILQDKTNNNLYICNVTVSIQNGLTISYTDLSGNLVSPIIGNLQLPYGSSTGTTTSTALTISGTATTGTIGVSYAFVPVVSGGSGTKTYTLTGTLPAGLSFITTTGGISGTPTASGTFTGLSISVSDSSGSASLSTFSLTIAAALTISGTPSATAYVGSAYNFQPVVSGGTGTKTYTLTGTLPAGLSLSTSTGILSGTPTTSGSFTGIRITVTDANNVTAVLGPFSIGVAANPVLNNLTVSNASYITSSAQGTLIGAIQGITANSTIALTNSNTNAVQLTGTNLYVGSNVLSSATTYTITITETLANATNSPKANVITITVAAGSSSSIGGGSTNTADLTDSNNDYLVALLAA